MEEEIRKLLGEEIKAEIQDLSILEPGSKEKSTAIEDLAILYKLIIEETKNELDFNGNKTLKKDQLDEQVKDRYFRIGVEIANLILPILFYSVWMRRGFKFEETGAYTSTTFRGLFNRFKPTNK